MWGQVDLVWVVRQALHRHTYPVCKMLPRCNFSYRENKPSSAIKTDTVFVCFGDLQIGFCRM